VLACVLFDGLVILVVSSILNILMTGQVLLI